MSSPANNVYLVIIHHNDGSTNILGIHPSAKKAFAHHIACANERMNRNFSVIHHITTKPIEGQPEQLRNSIFQLGKYGESIEVVKWKVS